VPLLAQLAARAPFSWWIAGDGPEEAALKAAAARAGLAERVRLLGSRDDVPELLLAADALLVPSLAEQLPLVVLEALRAGVPHVLVSAAGAAEEMRGLGARVLPLGRLDLWRAGLAAAAASPGGAAVPAGWDRDAARRAADRLAYLEALAERRLETAPARRAR